MLLHERIDAQAEQRPDKVAIHFEEEAITYAELARRGRAAASLLESHGVSERTVVPWLASNQPFMIELFYACSVRGAILMPLNSRLSAAEHATLLDHAGADLLFVEPAMEATARAIPGERAVVVTDGAGLAVEPVADLGSPTIDDDLLLVYTSGTTGSPKGAVHTQRSIAVTVDNGIESQGLTPDDISVIFLPLFHVGGLNIQTLPLLCIGGTVVLHRSFDPGAALRDIERFAATRSLWVPATIRAIIEHPDWPTADLTSITGLQTGSSVVPHSLLRALNERGLRAGQVYGSTETGPTCVVLPSEESDRVGAAGRAAPHSEVRIVDDELQIKGDHLFTHYRDDLEATSAAFDDGWYRTGDLAHFDDDGYVWIDGRTDDLIISGGENVDPVQVEEALISAPGVADIAIVGAPDERWGQVPVAFVVADGEPPSLETLRAHGEISLAKFKLPARIELVDELPRTALGKVKKFELRDRL